MRNMLLVIACSILFYSCTESAYRLSDYEKGKLRGYHANEANRLIDQNKKNRKSNQRAAEKHRQAQNERLNELNRSRNDKKRSQSDNRQSLNMY